MMQEGSPAMRPSQTLHAKVAVILSAFTSYVKDLFSNFHGIVKERVGAQNVQSSCRDGSVGKSP